ncbi:CRISPR-associated endonuclease Cas2 [Candidatus Roizmanbacteria bacterium RIFCSPLOWO2_01_FULL_40_13]|nr:MAG: CRISPR-associated endonuclease Cas2 [Candidatus Roizmanbacteria bacterium RIFCSPLOWO2_01_FULL_40_13]
MQKGKKSSRSASSQYSFKPGEIRQIVLSALGLGILLGGTFLVTPNFPIIYSLFASLIKDISRKDIPKAKIRRALKTLEKKEIIELDQRGGEVFVTLKGMFTPVTLKYSLKPLLELKRKKQKWSGKWFMVFFDIPVKQNNKRNYLRKYLKDIGFYPYQQSVYIYPYECEQEVVLIKKIVESAKYLSYVVAEKIENDKPVKIYFGLS